MSDPAVADAVAPGPSITGSAVERLAGRLASISPIADRLAPLVVVAIAALTRLPGIAGRGRFDADQGHDMTVLMAFVRDGVLPLLGPRTSVGEFHHGAFYYYLLAPAAAVSGGDPVIVTAWLALLGIAAVALTWWLARAIAGPVAGFVAGLLLAVSPAGIEQSTFIWNPNPIACFAVLALAAAWRARSGGSRWWWTVALGAAGAVVQLHVLGLVFFIGLVILVALVARRDWAAARGPLAMGLGVVALLFAPLLAHELQTGFLEVRLMVDYLGGGEAGTREGPVVALAFTLLRVVVWPLVGLVTEVPTAAVLALALVVGLVAWRAWAAWRTAEARRTAPAIGLAWLVWLLTWSIVALAFAAPSLQRVVSGLPNDHYHAFLDPVVVMLLAIASAGLIERAATGWREARAGATRRAATTRRAALAAGGAIGAALGVVVVGAALRWPPAVDPDGGWPAARDAGARIAATSGSGTIALLGIPEFKLPDGIGYPIRYAGGRLWDPGATEPRPVDSIAVACDRLFEAVVGASCGGPAEDALVASRFPLTSGVPRLIERFEASPRTVVSVYQP